MQITLNLEAAAVLLRCLVYGKGAITKHERESGVESVILENVRLIQDQICRGVAQDIIERAVKGAKR